MECCCENERFHFGNDFFVGINWWSTHALIFYEEENIAFGFIKFEIKKMKKKSLCEDEFLKRNRVDLWHKWKRRRVSFLRHSSKSFIFISLMLLDSCDKLLPLKAGLSNANSCLAFSGSSSETNLGSEMKEKEKEYQTWMQVCNILWNPFRRNFDCDHY